MRVRRSNDLAPQRRDGEWIALLKPVKIKVCQGMVMDLEPLAGYARFTQRTSTAVVECRVIEEQE